MIVKAITMSLGAIVTAEATAIVLTVTETIAM